MRVSRALAGLVGVLVAFALLAGAKPSTARGQEVTALVNRYVALGDSYTAAPLVPRLLPAGGCFRSTGNYPHRVARALGLAGRRFADVSCSGARTVDVTGSQQTPLGGVPPQLRALTTGTDLVTISIGGNDFDIFDTVFGRCPTMRSTDPTGAPCRNATSSHGRNRLVAAAGRTSRRLLRVVRQVRRRSPHARVLVVGYPFIVPRHRTCPSRLPLATGDYRFADRLEHRLNHGLRHAARVTGSTYVDMYAATRGHGICSRRPWVNGQDTIPGRALAYHPFGAEQRAVARLVVSRLR